jgi:hypothetical protein
MAVTVKTKFGTYKYVSGHSIGISEAHLLVADNSGRTIAFYAPECWVSADTEDAEEAEGHDLVEVY